MLKMTLDAELSLAEKDFKCIAYSRKLALDVLNNAGTGHTGATLSLTPLFYLLYSKVLTHRPSEPNWPQRDKLILSCGHAVLAQYIQLFACGYKISINDLKEFRKIDSITPGHPEFEVTPGIEVSSGPLGQGFATSVGVAIFNKRRALLNKNFRDNIKVYCVVSDGDLQEGISFEAANLASIYNLDNLIVLYDFNQITIDGDLSNSSIADHAEIFDSQGWVIDIGANIGELSMSIVQKFPNQKFLIIEPSSEEMAAAKRNLKGENFHFNSSALWKVNATLRFYHANKTGDSSLLPKDLSAPSELIEARTLDSIVETLGINQINLLKLEAEGAEPEILDGAIKTLMKTRFVAADLGPERGPNQLPTYFECKSKLEVLGFKEFSSYEGNRETYLFINTSLI